MDEAGVERALLAAMQKGPFIEIFKDLVKVAVAEATAAKDAEIKELKTELTEIKTQLNTMEQYSRRFCVNVTGVPERGRGEDTDRIVMDVAKLAGVSITKDDIDATHRIGTASAGKTRTIVARFNKFGTRREFYDARKQLRQPRNVPTSCVSAEEARKVFVADNLTRENQFILFQSRQAKREGKVHSAWSDLGRLKVRLRENGPTHVIKTLDDLTKLIQTTPQEVGVGGIRRSQRVREGST